MFSLTTASAVVEAEDVIIVVAESMPAMLGDVVVEGADDGANFVLVTGTSVGVETPVKHPVDLGGSGVVLVTMWCVKACPPLELTRMMPQDVVEAAAAGEGESATAAGAAAVVAVCEGHHC